MLLHLKRWRSHPTDAYQNREFALLEVDHTVVERNIYIYVYIYIYIYIPTPC